MAVRNVVRLPDRQAQQNHMAVKRIDVRTKEGQEYLAAVLPLSLAARNRPWLWYNRLGEIHYAVGRSARIAGYATLHAVKYAPNGEIDSVVDTGRAAEIVESIYSPYGGVRGLIDRWYTQSKVVGDSHLVKVAESGVDGYCFLSPSELRYEGDTVHENGIVNPDSQAELKWVTLPTGPLSGDNVLYGGARELSRKVSRRNYLGRVWVSHSQYIDAADSPLRALDTECELLYTSTQTLKAKLRQRLAAAGILYVPSEIQSIGSGEQTAITEDKILDTLIAIMTRNIESWDTAQALAPIIFRGAGIHSDQLRFIQMERDIFETDIKLRAELIDRILFGLDIQKQAATGETNNRYQAWNSSDEERRIAVQPDLEMCCWALRRLVLNRELRPRDVPQGDSVSDYGIWFSLDKAAIQAHRQEDTKLARELILVNDAAARRGLGIPETDAIVGAERIRAIGLATKNEYLMAWGTPEFDKIDWDIAMSKGKNPGPTPGIEDTPPGPGKGDPGGPGTQDPETPDESE